MTDIDFDIEELADFELVAPQYFVELYGFDADDQCTDFHKLVNIFTDYAEAEKFAEDFVLTDLPAEPTVYVRVEVQEVIDTEDISESVDLYSRVLKESIKT